MRWTVPIPELSTWPASSGDNEVDSESIESESIRAYSQPGEPLPKLRAHLPRQVHLPTYFSQHLMGLYLTALLGGLSSRPPVIARMQLLGTTCSLLPGLCSLLHIFPRPGSHPFKPAAGCAAPQGRSSRHIRVQHLVGEDSQDGLLQQKSGDEMLPSRGQEA